MTAAPPPGPPPGSSIHVRDPRALKALAHPLRTRLLGLLRLDGPSTATLLGQRVGESSGSTSYHLRQLAAYGFVEDVVGEGTGRERWWQAAHRSTSWSTTDFAGDPEGSAVAEEMQLRLLDHRRRLLTAWSEQRGDLPTEWRQATTFNDLAMHLTPEQTRQMTDELVALLVRWRDEEQSPPGSPGTQVVQVLADLFPLQEIPL